MMKSYKDLDIIKDEEGIRKVKEYVSSKLRVFEYIPSSI